MTIPPYDTAPPLLTDADVLRRVRELVGPACVDERLWLMLVDGDARQSPVLLPIDGVPRRPEPGGLPGLAALLGSVGEQLRTDLGTGSVILTLERLGPAMTLPDDRAWARALADTCADAGIGLRGVFLSTTGGVHRLR